MDSKTLQAIGISDIIMSNIALDRRDGCLLGGGKITHSISRCLMVKGQLWDALWRWLTLHFGV